MHAINFMSPECWDKSKCIQGPMLSSRKDGESVQFIAGLLDASLACTCSRAAHLNQNRSQLNASVESLTGLGMSADLMLHAFTLCEGAMYLHGGSW